MTVINDVGEVWPICSFDRRRKDIVDFYWQFKINKILQLHF